MKSKLHGGTFSAAGVLLQASSRAGAAGPLQRLQTGWLHADMGDKALGLDTVDKAGLIRWGPA